MLLQETSQMFIYNNKLGKNGSMGKIVYLIIDGLGGLPTRVLKDKTALESAEKPNLDYFAAKGAVGLTKNFNIDHEKFLAENGSNFGYISLLGTNPRETSWKRGPIEAVGMNAMFTPGKDLAVRMNFAYANLKGEVEDRRAGKMSNSDGRKFVEEIKEKINYKGNYELIHALGHRVLLILKDSQELGEEITGSDPLDVGKKLQDIKPLKSTDENIRSANALRNFEERAHSVLLSTQLNSGRRSKGGYPVTHLISRGIGSNIPELNIYEEWAAICTSPVEFGIAKIAKMDILGIENPTENYEEDIPKTLEVLKKHWNDYEKFMIFIKGPDTYGHSGNSMMKVKSIEMIDRTIVAFLKEKMNLKTDVLCVTADHATPCKLMRHTAEPIPLLISGKIDADNVTVFSEKYCKEGALGEVKGYDIMKKLYKLYRS